jgi:hypothetical protein
MSRATGIATFEQNLKAVRDLGAISGIGIFWRMEFYLIFTTIR